MTAHSWVQRMMARRFDLAVLPLAVAAILAATVVPVDLRAAQLAQENGRFDLWDFVQNVLLFAPLGIALCRSSWTAIFATPLVLTLSIELLQIWEFERFPSPFDILANVMGAVIAASAARRWSHLHRAVLPANGWLILACVLIAGCLLVVWQLPRRSAAIADWNARFALLLGNELSANRPWRGTIDDLAIWDRVLARGEIRALATDDAVALPPSGLVHADARRRQLGGGVARRLSADAASTVAARVQQTGEFSLALRVRTSDLAQEGPARIVSFSRSTQARNFDLGQARDRIVFRVRNAVSGPNGQDFRAETGGVLRAGAGTPIVATYDGAIARIFVDGLPQGRSNIAAAGCRVAALCDSALPIAWATLGAALAAIAIAFVGAQARVRIVIICIATALVLVFVERAVGLMPADIAARPWLPFTAVLGALAVGLAYDGRNRSEA